jgi:hypothetical protein
MIRSLFLCCLGLVLCACAVTRNATDLAEVRARVDVARLQGVRLHILDSAIRTSNQGFERLYTLHHSAQEVKQILRQVVQHYGFIESPVADRVYELEVLEVMPDGGQCFNAEALQQGASKAVSILTVGVAPAASGYCMAVRARLYFNDYEERVLVDEYFSDAGRIEVYASNQELGAYRRTVDRVIEARAIEASLAGLFNVMLEDGAF